MLSTLIGLRPVSQIRRRMPLALLAASFSFSAGPDLFSQDEAESVRAYQASRIYYDGGLAVDNGYLIVRNGQVEQVIADASELPPFIEVEYLGDAVLIPGLVSADSAISGLSAFGRSDRSMGAHRLAIDEFDPYADLTSLLSRGVTTYYMSPTRDRLIGGRGAVVKTAGSDRILKKVGDLRVSLKSSAWYPGALVEAPLPPSADNPIKPGQPQPPESRAGALLALRQQPDYVAAELSDFNIHQQGMRDYLAGQEPLRMVADSDGDLRGALEIAQLWGKPLVVDGGEHADRWAQHLAEQQAALIFKVPLFSQVASLPDSWQPPADDALRKLHDAGVPVALAVGSYASWTLLLEAATAAQGYGLTAAEALAAITEIPAEILGVAERVGTLRPGRDADFLVMTGDPLSQSASVARVYVEGELVWNVADLEEEGERNSDSTVIRAGTIWTGSGATVTGGGEVLLRDGKVVAVGKSVPHPIGTKVVDAGEDAHVTPGFIDLRGAVNSFRLSRVDPKVDVGLLAAGGRFQRNWQAVARAGITSMVLTPSSWPREGARGALVKTAGVLPQDSYIDEHEIVFMNYSGGDAPQREEGLEQTLRGAKSYFDKWEKYRKDRAKWEKEQVDKTASDQLEAEAALRKRLVQGAVELAPQKEKKEEESDADSEDSGEDESQQKVDPLNGLWEGTIEHEMLPEPITAQARMRHEGPVAVGVFSSPDDPSGQSIELEGTWNEGEQRVFFSLATEFGQVSLSGQIDAPDHMFCRIELSGFGSAEFEAVRTEIDGGNAPIVSKRKKAKKDEGPQEPKKDWRYEGLRALFEGRGVAVVQADLKHELETLSRIFAEYKLPLAIMGGSQANQLDEGARDSIRGVVAPPNLVQRVRNRTEVAAADLAAEGFATGFQTGGTRSSRFLPETLSLATHFGLGPETALRGLTSDAARLIGLQDRLGTLAPGYDADVVIHSGPPLQLGTEVIRVFVNGKEVPQTW